MCLFDDSIVKIIIIFHSNIPIIIQVISMIIDYTILWISFNYNIKFDFFKDTNRILYKQFLCLKIYIMPSG